LFLHGRVSQSKVFAETHSPKNGVGDNFNQSREATMKSETPNVFFRLLGLLKQIDGQDLVEYALLVALISLSATAGMKSLATKIDTAFTGLSTTLTSYTS
jgi:pilus assembly protein Flp/PilA